MFSPHSQVNVGPQFKSFKSPHQDQRIANGRSIDFDMKEYTSYGTSRPTTKHVRTNNDSSGHYPNQDTISDTARLDSLRIPKSKRGQKSYIIRKKKKDDNENFDYIYDQNEKYLAELKD
jgi:hypothetical protein